MQFTAEYLQNVVKMLPGNIALYTYGEKLRLIGQSESLCRLLGFSSAELTELEQWCDSGLIAVADYDMVIHNLERELTDGRESFELVCRMVHKDDEYIWVRLSIRYVGEYEGQRALIAAVFDYSGEMSSHIDLLEMSDRAICLADSRTRRIIYANKLFAASFELPVESCFGYADANDIAILRPYLDGADTLSDTKRSQQYDEQHDKTYMVLAKKLRFGGTEAIAFYLQDITEHEIVYNRLAKQNQQIRSMQDEAVSAYHHQLDMIMQLTPDAVSTFQINVTRNICHNGSCKYANLLRLQDKGTLDGYFEDAGQYVEPEEYREARKVLNRQHLLREFADGRTSVTAECHYLLAEGYERMLRTIVSMVKNPTNQDIEGVIYTVDITDYYIAHKIKELLLSQRYDGIFLIDNKRETVSIINTSMDDLVDSFGSSGDYEELLSYFASRYIADEERERYIGNSSLDGLRTELSGHRYYSFTIGMQPPDKRRQLMRFSFSYLDDDNDYIMVILENVTYDLSRDIVTGAYSRQGFINYAEKLLRNSAPEEEFAILFLNIRGFKAINELFGTSGGDRVLMQSVEMLRKSGLKPLAVGRLEADHFVCLLERSHIDFDVLVELCQRIYVEDSRQFRFYAHCGVYLIEDKSKSVAVMCDYAKLAKEFTADDFARPYAVFNESMRDQFVEKKKLTSEFKSSLENDEFLVYYQPVFNVKTGAIASAEALVRWNHRKSGMISPGKFIPVFEENGFIMELDFFVEESVLKFQQQRLRQGGFAVPVAVNLSRMDFMSDERRIQAVTNVQKAGLPMNLMRIEITESAYAAMAESSTELLSMIRELGIKILIDDFGSGYSSFSTLKDFKFDILKLDMGFVQQIGTSRETELIIQALIDMAHKLKVEVIAEGVETKEQAAFLAQADCDYIQGYYYSRPLPEADFAALLDAAVS